MPSTEIAFEFASTSDLYPELGAFSTDGSISIPTASTVLLILFLIVPIVILCHIVGRLIFGVHQKLPELSPQIRNLADHAFDQAKWLHIVMGAKSPAKDFAERFKNNGSTAIVLSEPAFAKGTDAQVIILDKVENFFVDNASRRWLEHRMTEWQKQDKCVYAFCRVDPDFWLRQLSANQLTEAQRVQFNHKEILFWSEILEEAEILRAPISVGSGTTQAQKTGEFAQNWALSTTQERSVLLNIATSGIFNPRNQDVVTSLVRRGLLKEDPPHGFIDERTPPAFSDVSFEAFVANHEDVEGLREWQKNAKNNVWSALWPTLLIIIGVLVFFVVSAGRNAVDTALAVMGSIVAAMPVLLSVLAAARGGRSVGAE